MRYTPYKPVDKASKKLVMSYLKTKNLECLDTDEISIYSHSDLICTTQKGNCIWVEIKNRTCTSTKYKDSMCEYLKFLAYQDLYSRGEVKKGLLISIYTDQVMTISDITKGRTDYKMCPHTTAFEDRSLMEKATWHCDQELRLDISSGNPLTFKKLPRI